MKVSTLKLPSQLPRNFRYQQFGVKVSLLIVVKKLLKLVVFYLEKMKILISVTANRQVNIHRSLG